MDPNQLNPEAPIEPTNNPTPGVISPNVVSPTPPQVIYPNTAHTPASPIPTQAPVMPTAPLPQAPQFIQSPVTSFVSAPTQQPLAQASPAAHGSATPPVFSGGGGNNISASTQIPSPGSSDSTYISNPFLNAVRGLVLTLSSNPKPALMCAFLNLVGIVIVYVLLILLIFGVGPIGALIGILALFFVSVVSVGTFYVIGGASARSEVITTRDAYSRSLSKFFPFLFLSILTLLMLIVGFILLIIPGFIVLARVSLASIVMFEEDLGPIASIKRSFSLTKGHTNEMLGAIYAGLLIGEAYYSLLFGAISVSPLVGRYHDLRQLQESGQPNPPVSKLNYIYLLFPVAFALLFILLLIPALHNAKKNHEATTTQNYSNFQNQNNYSQ